VGGSLGFANEIAWISGKSVLAKRLNRIETRRATRWNGCGQQPGEIRRFTAARGTV